MKITRIEIEYERIYSIGHLTEETIAEFVTDIQKVKEKDLNKVLKKYGVT